MDIISYFLLGKFFSGKILVPIFDYFQLGTYDVNTLSYMASDILSDLDKEQTGEEEAVVKLPITKLMLFGVLHPISA